MKNLIRVEERWSRIEAKARRFLSPEGFRIARRWYLGPEPGDFEVPAFIARRTFPKQEGGEKR